MKKWVIIDEKHGDMFEQIMDVDSKESAVQVARWLYDDLSSHDKAQRTAFYVGLADVDDEGFIDWETGINDIVNIQ